jgi:signal transduction histidine kinase
MIKISDRGYGFSKEELQAICSPLTDTAASTTWNNVGISTEKYIVELHGGDFVVESAPEIGTNIFFTLPKLHI